MSVTRILQGDCIDVLKTLEPNSIDACVTDPPYELGFMGKHWDRSGVAFDPLTWGEVFRVVKPGAYLLACGGTRTAHRMAAAIEDSGFEIRDSIAWLYGSGFPKSLNLGEGLGTALKPAHEPIVLARKPFKGSVRHNVEQHGTGALNIDACRIAGDEDGSRNRPPSKLGGTCYAQDKWTQSTIVQRQDTTGLGRWPANVCLNEFAAMVLDEQSGELVDGVAVQRNGGGQRFGSDRTYSGYDGGLVRPDTGYGGSGGASRFFYVAKPSREERDYGCEGLQQLSGGEATNRKDGSAGLENPRAGAGRTGGGRNGHPTVKPVELMRWLVRLVTPIGGTVLDPFLGSGTTGMACRYEQRNFIGIEREAEYIAIAERRIAAVAPLFSEERPT